MLDFLSASDDYLLIKLSMFAISFAGSAFIMVIIEVTLVKELSSVTFSVLVVGKDLLVVFLSTLFYHDSLSNLNKIGFALALCGIVTFRHFRSKHPGVAAFDETDGAIERSRTEDLGQTALILLGRVGVADQEATQLIS